MDLTMCGNPADFLDRYRGNIALNVKYRGNPKLSDETLKKLARLDGATRDNVVRFAEEAVRDSWWATMQERSREQGLGDLWSDGRSGGWLVFKITVSRLEEVIEETEKQCKHCELHFDKHFSSKCPFEATIFEPENPQGLKMWEAFRTFSAEVKESLQTIGDSFEHEVLFQLENLDDYGATGPLAVGGSEANPEAFNEGPEDDGG